ncbi:MAG: HD-GYP domain-containing protein [Desulfobacteraceae bacterium]|nr:HD-GYP domain-containing protein [Desulfobacteraceae bacterium]
MAAVTDYLFDTSFLSEVLAYLESAHSIRGLVVDSAGKPVVPAAAVPEPAPPASRFFPFKFAEDVGGLLCQADSETAMEAAAPHVAICVAGVRHLLQREAELQQAGGEMLELSEQLHFLFRLANKIIGISNLQEFCTVVLREVGSAIAADSGLVKTSVLWKDKVEISWQLPPERRRELEGLKFLHEESAERTVIHSLADGSSILIAPIRGKEGTVGHMAFFKKGGRPFTAYQKKFLSIIENIYSPTIETIRLYDSLQELYLNTVKALAAAIDAKDEYTHGHSFRVARFAVAIGNNMGIRGRDLADLQIAAFMHDLGKIGIPEAILSKPGKLTPAEFVEIKKHPVFTDKILQPINLPSFIVDAAVHHHERLDGSGYPDGLKAQEISPFARIIAVADVFDALTSARPYRQAMPVETALKIMCEGIDTQFDRKVVLALVSSLREEEIDSVLADHNIKLHFAEVHHLNDFLRELIDFLLPETERKRRRRRSIAN